MLTTEKDAHLRSKCGTQPMSRSIQARGHSFTTYATKGSSAVRMPMYCCYSGVIISAYRVGGWVCNPEICVYVLHEWPLACNATTGVSHNKHSRSFFIVTQVIAEAAENGSSTWASAECSPGGGRGAQ